MWYKKTLFRLAEIWYIQTRDGFDKWFYFVQSLDLGIEIGNSYKLSFYLDLDFHFSVFE